MTKRNVVRIVVAVAVAVAVLVAWRTVSRARWRSVVEDDYEWLHALYSKNPSPSPEAIGRHFDTMVEAPNGRKPLERLDHEHDRIAYDAPRNIVYFIHERSDATPGERRSCLGWAYRNQRRRGEAHADFPRTVSLDEVIATTTGVTIRFRASSEPSERAAVVEQGLEPGARYEVSMEPPEETLDAESALKHARRI